MKRIILSSLILALGASEALAQYPPRIEDHFWRRKVVNRIDLTEKINQPLVKRESPFYTDESQFSEKDGLIMALFNGLKAGKYVAYHPDSLAKPLSYEDVLARIQEFDNKLTGEVDLDEAEGGDGAGFDGTDPGFDSFSGEGDEWGDPTGEDFSDDLSTEAVPAPGGAAAGSYQGDFDSGPYETVLHFVEDRIFDKVRSDMVYDVQLIELIWTDPGETLPEAKLCTFQYKDVIESLEQVQWKNRFNDAEYKNLREVFELRLFHSYIVQVSGVGATTLQEAELERQKMVEFEHHLWSY